MLLLLQIKDLLHHIRDDLNSLQITEELKITQNFAEEGRMYGIFLIGIKKREYIETQLRHKIILSSFIIQVEPKVAMMAK